MKDRKNNKIEAGDKIKVLWKLNNREYPGDVIIIKGNIALISVKNSGRVPNHLTTFK
jgi:hypothetical protein